MKIFIDTGAFIALFASAEKHHKQVAKQYADYRKQRAIFFTSYYVLDELFTRLMYDFGKSITQKAVEILNRAIEKEELSVFDIDETVFKKAQKALIKFSEHKISFTDATSYILYKDFGLDSIFTLDDDFKKIRVKPHLKKERV